MEVPFPIRVARRRLVIGTLGRLHPGVDAIASLGVAPAEITPIKAPVRQIVPARISAPGAERTLSRRGADNRLHGPFIGRLRIFRVTVVPQIGCDGMEPIRFPWTEHRQDLVSMIIRVKNRGERDLPQIGPARDASGLRLGPAQGRKQQAGQNCDDGNDDEQFDERKSSFRSQRHFHGWREA